MDCPAYHHISQSPPVIKHTNLPHHISSNLIADIQQLRNSEVAQMEHTEILERWHPSPILMIVSHEDEKDPHSPQQVTRKVKMVIHKWGHVQPINPERFFLKMLLSRGYSTKMIPATTSQNKWYDILRSHLIYITIISFYTTESNQYPLSYSSVLHRLNKCKTMIMNWFMLSKIMIFSKSKFSINKEEGKIDANTPKT